MADKRRLLVILGAGSSVQCGMPWGKTLNDLMSLWAQQYACRGDLDDLYAQVQKTLTKYRDTPQDPEVNFERTLADMAALAHGVAPSPWHNSAWDVRRGANPPPRLNISKTHSLKPQTLLQSQYTYLVFTLAKHMRDLCRDPVNIKHLEEYQSLVHSFQDAFDVGIYNLNYDTLALSASGSAFTGFTDNGCFNAREVHRRSKWDFIYHLHGSVHHIPNLEGGWIKWCPDLNSNEFNFEDSFFLHNRVSDAKILRVMPIIAGGFKLDQLLSEPFHSFHARLVRDVYEADAILVAGYGFGDAHVNLALHNRLRCVVQERPPVLILDWAEPQDAFACSEDRFTREACIALSMRKEFFHPAGHASQANFKDPDLGEIFEVAMEYRAAFWRWGFLRARSRIKDITKWLNGADETVLA